MRMFWISAAAVAAGVFLVLLGLVALTFGRPPQPLPLGTVQWLGEAGATVDGVDRVASIGSGRDRVRARGEFYIVHARIVAPYGLRPTWHDGDVEVRTFAGTGATTHDRRFSVDERAQAVLDRLTRRPGPIHLVRGASEREDLVFDLPRDVEQPALVFIPANDPLGMLDWAFGRF